MTHRSPIAVVGMAGLFPGAFDLHTYWQNIINKYDAAKAVPDHRWIADPERMVQVNLHPDKALSRRCCLIEDFRFDPAGIEIEPDLIMALDPLYHVILHTGRAAVSEPVRLQLKKERTGVALAAIALPTDASSTITRQLFGSLFEEKLFGHTEYTLPGTSQSLAAKVTSLPGAVLAKGLGLGGGSYTLDAACASSIYAVKLACDALQSYRADAMLAGGVSRPECLYTQVGFSQLRALSPSGRCAPFDGSADGLVVGEGAGILVLKRLEDALQTGDPICGIIRGIGLSNDMRGNLLAPDSEGQIRAMQAAYDQAGWTPTDVDLIECHGTGAPKGDATELSSLRELWGNSGWHPGQCAIGSVKSMIGHLLTGAGAAGMIKILLAIQNRILPPSLHFESPPANSPLIDSPFRVQTEPEEWSAHHLRRAAVSAFGFGGINAHLLFEEWGPEKTPVKASSSKYLAVDRANRETKPISGPDIRKTRGVDQNPIPIAIVGMEASFGSASTLREFQEIVFNGHTVISPRPPNRWKGCGRFMERLSQKQPLAGGFLDEIQVEITDFHIPPKEIPDILPQHLLMLKVAAGAMADAGLPLRQERPRMGVIIGLDFDFEATNFHFRWSLPNLAVKWSKKYDIDLNSRDTEQWLSTLQDSACPPLTASRTLGALGSIVASRIAREFRFGGPSFTVSADEASGIKALEIGVRSLQQEETDAVLVGAIDFCGDARRTITGDNAAQFSRSGKIRPFDRYADGTLAGEGATALVLKPLSRAIADGDRIYAVIKGIGNAGGGVIEEGTLSMAAYRQALESALAEADISPPSIGYVETHGSGIPAQDQTECAALHDFFGEFNNSCAIGTTKPNIGHAGAAAGLASIVKTGLCLFQEIIPPVVNFSEPANSLWHKRVFHIPRFPQYWLRDRQAGPHRACISTMTSDCNCSVVILESSETSELDRVSDAVVKERKRPLGAMPLGLFVVDGNDKNSLLSGLETLLQFVRSADRKDLAIEACARHWFEAHPPDPTNKCAVVLAAGSVIELPRRIKEAEDAVSTDTSRSINAKGGVAYTPFPVGSAGETAFVYPGSGNHYLGMGRQLGLVWPEILRTMDAGTPRLKSQSLPERFIPHRVSWESGWEIDAHDGLVSDPLNMIFGQVVLGGVMTNLVQRFGIRPAAVIGYSLGESAGLFAMQAWPDRDEMLKRMEHTDLFQDRLAGACHSLRTAWGVAPQEEFDWRAAVVNRPAQTVKKAIRKLPYVRLLIINTPEESVIGGRKDQVQASIKNLDCDAYFLEGVVTVHCDAALPAAQAYKALHMFPTTPTENVRFYSCASGQSYEVTQENAAASILKQTLNGFDFTQTIEQAYSDGVRLFLEMGPGASCSRMVKRILEDRPHLAVSASTRSEGEFATLLKFLGTLIAERAAVDLTYLYGPDAFPPSAASKSREKDSHTQRRIPVGGNVLAPALPENRALKRKSIPAQPYDQKPESRIQRPESNIQDQLPTNDHRAAHVDFSESRIEQPTPSVPSQDPYTADSSTDNRYTALIKEMQTNMEATTKAHKTFLEFSEKLTRSYGKTFNLQAQLLQTLISKKDSSPADLGPEFGQQIAPMAESGFSAANRPPVAYTREQCLEFATGKVADVLGPEFALVDTYSTRVRLPDEPLMLVDRILSVQGEKRSLTSGRVVTEHDVRPGAWYLDTGRVPVCIAVEAGQADLFLCAYLGIDLKAKGERVYRLLDASVVFHRGLPCPGDVIRYEIEIEKFIRQGDTYIFFFRFEGLIGNEPLISMTDGCAGFFTEAEIHNSGGIILSEEETQARAGKKDPAWKNLVAIASESYDDAALEALRGGDLAACFGAAFEGVKLAEPLWLPGGRMKLIDRILALEPAGGRFGLGMIRAEADIHPDDWFLTCHFVDDMTMPGTLMYECCAHTLRVFLQRIGWITGREDVCYEPVVGVKSVLKCRGPVTPQTRQVVYEVEIKEIGYGPDPYVIADANMYADGQYIVRFTDMSLKSTGLTRRELEDFWQTRVSVTNDVKDQRKRSRILFDRDKILAFAVGSPSEAFGDRFKIFDENRFIARLPGPPYSFIDRVVTVEPPAGVLKPDGWIEAEYDVRPDDWYFRANRSPVMPFCILLEIALQPCGWLAAYSGSALTSDKDLRFRNLDGRCTQYHDVLPDAGTLTVRCRMRKVSRAGDIIIEEFDLQVLQGKRRVYAGVTSFGFFTFEALTDQKGIQEEAASVYRPQPAEIETTRSMVFEDHAPLTPDDPNTEPVRSLAMPARAIRMTDRIDIYLPQGGPAGLGYIRGKKRVDPKEWFFKAHFHQDPVCPGSLGIESFLQLLKHAALERWPHLSDSHRFVHSTELPHVWKYRGQILSENQQIEVEACVTTIGEDPGPEIRADGYLYVDGLCIYKMENFGIRLVPK